MGEMTPAEINEYITHLRIGIALKNKRISSLEAALVEIRDHPHCSPSCTSDCDGEPAHYDARDDGIRMGHRCCADIARKALEK